MPALDQIDPIYLVSGFVGIAAVLAVEAIYLLFFSNVTYRKRINRRLDLMSDKPNREEALVILRRERGLTGEGFYMTRVKAFNRLVLQSGVTLGLYRVALLMAVAGLASGLGVWIWKQEILWAAIAVPLFGLAVPLFMLRWLRARRHNKFAAQFPDAIDIIVRSLKAGHPVPIAIAMVAREMGDPVGTEFGILADEVTYGSDLETAMRNLMFRVGQEDLPLFVTAVSIQTASGGNLREILDGLSQVIRERGKLRRKVRSISTEGRMSAYILTAVPILLACSMQVMMPEMYGSVIDEPLTWYLLSGTVFWLILGNAIMFKMSNFKF